jgi:hypothetical protein
MAQHEYRVTVALTTKEVVADRVDTERESVASVTSMLAQDYHVDGLLHLTSRLIPWSSILHVEVQYVGQKP